MNYTVIIILIVLLFVIYQLKTSEKKEGFSLRVPSLHKSCPQDFNLSSDGKSCSKHYNKNSCDQGDVKLYRHKKKDYCLKTAPLGKCPESFVEASSVKCCPRGYKIWGYYNSGDCVKS
jgi:hypothetical protein